MLSMSNWACTKLTLNQEIAWKYFTKVNTKGVISQQKGTRLRQIKNGKPENLGTTFQDVASMAKFLKRRAILKMFLIAINFVITNQKY